ncbi:sensor histidine kinase [Peredibacter starrii]|uniref:histidine kinase n=1 Tax=Peredibacter starrii TaxID=28202 RepID=A0AAX4HTK3_9BACT|nr:sensor histidine kinase [Peredibacter starrii]WPU66503.1 sensor histidine kinase [Peredibacter starrii]
MPQLEEAMYRSIYGQMLLDNRKKLLALFIQKVRQTMPSAKTLDDRTLENSLFEFITSIAKIISLEADLDNWDLFKENVEASREHGKSRAKIASYTLDQVISEFRLLRSLIFSALEEDGTFPAIERDKILFAIDNGMTQAATEFAYERGFKDARLSKEISAKNLALDEANFLRNERKQRETFFSTVTHDMRNPLSIIKSSAEMIVKRPDDLPSVLKYANKIIKNIDRSNVMIKDLLDSKMLRSGGKLSLQKVECDLGSIIKETCEDLSEVYGPRFKTEKIPTVKGRFDCSGLKRALENLMINAIKYGAPDKPIKVSLNQTKTELCIQVHNEGNPIPLKDQASLFEYYHRSNVQNGSQLGWGIGLTLVKGIAEGHDGKVEVRSSKDEGTTFFIILPI